MDCITVHLDQVNAHITCYICKGYFVDATTVLDCLHTFCKSCLLKHFEESKRCPKCEILIHQSHPVHYVNIDRTMQDLVYKLVPNVQSIERERREVFCKERGLQLDEDSMGIGLGGRADHDDASPSLSPGQSVNKLNHATIQSQIAADPESLSGTDKPKTDESSSGGDAKTEPEPDYHRSDEQVIVQLQPTNSVKHLQRQFIRCSVQTTITHLKKFLAYRLYLKMDRFAEFDVFCNEELMGKDHSLKFIQKTRWRGKEEPLELQYRQHVDF